MPTTFAEAKTALDDISSVISSRRKELKSILQQATINVAALAALQTDFAALLADVNANLAANPADVAYQQQKAEKDLLVQEFLALKVVATAIRDAIDGASP